jgi:hypothetical protein
VHEQALAVVAPGFFYAQLPAAETFLPVVVGADHGHVVARLDDEVGLAQLFVVVAWRQACEACEPVDTAVSDAEQVAVAIERADLGA